MVKLFCIFYFLLVYRTSESEASSYSQDYGYGQNLHSDYVDTGDMYDTPMIIGYPAPIPPIFSYGFPLMSPFGFGPGFGSGGLRYGGGNGYGQNSYSSGQSNSGNQGTSSQTGGGNSDNGGAGSQPKVIDNAGSFTTPSPLVSSATTIVPALMNSTVAVFNATETTATGVTPASVASTTAMTNGTNATVVSGAPNAVPFVSWLMNDQNETIIPFGITLLNKTSHDETMEDFLMLSQRKSLSEFSELEDITIVDPNLPGVVFKRLPEDQVMENPHLFEGDILGIDKNASLADLTYLANLTMDDARKWHGGIIPYEISTLFQPKERTMIRDALKKFMDKTCITFRPKVTGDINFVYIVPGGGCSSDIGRQRDRQLLTLQTPDKKSKNGTGGCFNPPEYGIIHHELMHIAGFFHEQSRIDRDKFVKINLQNVRPGFEGDFQTYADTAKVAYGQPYDYSSVMHYDHYAFTKKKNLSTIDPLQDKERAIQVMGQRTKMSQTDMLKIDRAYCQLSANACPTTVGWFPVGLRCYYLSFLSNETKEMNYRDAKNYCSKNRALIGDPTDKKVLDLINGNQPEGDQRVTEIWSVNTCFVIQMKSGRPAKSKCGKAFAFVCDKRRHK